MQTIDFLPLVKAYPSLSKTYGEVSCIAGVEITPGGPRWIRLYPVPFRALDENQQFRKYQRVRLEVETHIVFEPIDVNEEKRALARAWAAQERCWTGSRRRSGSIKCVSSN